MAWIKVKDSHGKISVIPESVFKNSYESTGTFTRVEEPKPVKLQKEVEEYADTEIQLAEQGKTNNPRQSKKKD